MTLRLADSKSTIMYKGYTFSTGPRKGSLVCSRRRRGKCSARLRLDDDGNIVFAVTDHNHPPPQFHITSEGEYIKI